MTSFLCAVAYPAVLVGMLLGLTVSLGWRWVRHSLPETCRAPQCTSNSPTMICLQPKAREHVPDRRGPVQA